VSAVAHGRLRMPGEAPAEGELGEQILRVGGVTVEQILSGTLGTPMEFDQDHDEWVVVLSGSAVLEVHTQTLALRSGDWVFLPAHVHHRLVETERGTSWLALHAEP
jgi:cupin 2 domain-containing protein